ncbi:hypothetical protein AB6A40_003771 [Gnathostoma spinigerum]|uniref:Ground-like domain-containing protein n=1 Tax=Gnathostoma spinigerum TaxID=75299 RepID=A0ABD6EKG1_9BILA
MCCNPVLERLMRKVLEEVRDGPIGIINIAHAARVAGRLQELVEALFGVKFEVLLALSNFASKSHFLDEHFCKITQGSKFLLAYATPTLDKS